jgi:nicotinamidase-related amidase
MTAKTVGTRSTLAEDSMHYLAFLEEWLDNRPRLAMAELVEQSGGAEHIAIVSVDLIVGFCHTGALSSPRVAGILPAVSRVLTLAADVDIRNVILTQDTHRPDAEEFASYPPHCVAGTEESQTAPELMALPSAADFTIAEKNSISSIIAPAYLAWEQERGPFTTYVIVGDCTDLCVYQAAMALKVRSQANHLGQRVIVPVSCVETYDLPVATALEIGAQPHPGDLLHHVFLHSMAQNGIDVIADITS